MQVIYFFHCYEPEQIDKRDINSLFALKGKQDPWHLLISKSTIVSLNAILWRDMQIIKSVFYHLFLTLLCGLELRSGTTQQLSRKRIYALNSYVIYHLIVCQKIVLLGFVILLNSPVSRPFLLATLCNILFYVFFRYVNLMPIYFQILQTIRVAK
jgi:hypothetical protein